MDKTKLIELAHKMETRDDLLALLNRIKEEEMAERGAKSKFFPFTRKHMNYYCNPKNSFHRYTQFKIKKKTGGFRTITAPRNRSFKLMLHCLNELLKALYTPSDHATGFTEGRSVVTNAEVHRGANYILNLDLKDFFPSIEQPRVWKRLQLKPFGFPVAVANAIAGLCCMKESRDMPDGSRKDVYVLPQGAPTSPIITNMICDKLDRRLAGIARRFGLKYTRYADDITFSSMHNVYAKNGEFLTELRRIIADQGFTINEAKTRLQKVGGRQEVTGIIVSHKLNVTQKYVRDIRNILYIWDRYGYSDAFYRFYPKYKSDKGHVKKGIPNLINVIDGKLMYLKMVKGENDGVYAKLHEKFEELVNAAMSPQNTTEQNVTYLDTTTITDFERKNETEVAFSKSEDKYELTLENGNKHVCPVEGFDIAYVQSILGTVQSKQLIPGRRYAYFTVNKKKIYASINKSVTTEEIEKKHSLSISSCLDSKQKLFWLVHKTSKITVPTPQPVDLEELNNELDSLLNM